MDVRKRAWIGICAAMIFVGLAATAEAFYVDGKKTLSFTSKLQTRVSFRLQDASGYTQPDVQVGDLVQWRNLALLEVEHDLKELTKSLDILYPLKKLQIRSKYRLVGRFMYEALYNVGSDKFKAVSETDRENYQDFKQSYDIWEAYVDFARGPAFIRIGKQILAWGETDIFRLLDQINPLDNTFGGPFEDLDDRRIPLWMVRGSYNLGSVGPVASLTLEGFWVPGPWDVKVGPWAPWGTPYEVPLDKQVVYDILYINTPPKDMRNSRWGARVQGMLGSAINVSAAYFETFLDAPTTHFVLLDENGNIMPGIDGILGIDVPVDSMVIHGDYPKFQVVGGSMNFWESMTDFVFRAEIAYFIREPVWINGINNLPLRGDTIPLPWAALDALAVLTGSDVRPAGLDGLPLNPESGPIPVKDSLNWMLGFDKQLWMRLLNKKNMFFLSMQYFGKYYFDHDKNQLTPVPIPDLFLDRPNEITGQPIPDMTQYPMVSEVSTIFTGMINTTYLNGMLNPQFAMAYDTKGAWLFLPQIVYIREPFRFMLQYAGIVGQFNSFGLFRDRDQITFTFSYLLN